MPEEVLAPKFLRAKCNIFYVRLFLSEIIYISILKSDQLLAEVSLLGRGIRAPKPGVLAPLPASHSKSTRMAILPPELFAPDELGESLLPFSDTGAHRPDQLNLVAQVFPCLPADLEGDTSIASSYTHHPKEPPGIVKLNTSRIFPKVPSN